MNSNEIKVTKGWFLYRAKGQIDVKHGVWWNVRWYHDEERYQKLLAEGYYVKDAKRGARATQKICEQLAYGFSSEKAIERVKEKLCKEYQYDLDLDKKEPEPYPQVYEFNPETDCDCD